MNRKAFFAAIVGMALIGGTAPFASAQDAGGGQAAQGGRQRGQGGPGGGGQRFDPEQMRQRMEAMMKERLGVTDEEWTALQPKLQKVQQLQMQARASRFGSFGRGPGGPGGFGGQTADSPVAVASQELQTLLENKDAAPEQIQAKLKALREARAKAQEELTKAQAELKELLTARQEAVLVSMGTLE